MDAETRLKAQAWDRLMKSTKDDVTALQEAWEGLQAARRLIGSYKVNHNGTEDWTDTSPVDSAKLDDGTRIFVSLPEARAFAAEVARDALRWAMTDQGMTREGAEHMLRANREGVPVQVVDAATGEVVETVDPETV